MPAATWEVYRQLDILPALAKLQIKEQGYAVESPPLQAFVSHGKWLVQCECGGGEKVWDEGWMMCMSCLNGRHGHKYRPTKFPRQRRAIEGLLQVRPVPNRNWRPGENLALLRRDNQIHAAELLEVT